MVSRFPNIYPYFATTAYLCVIRQVRGIFVRVLRVTKLFSIISVKAKSFADREIRYTLKAQGQGAAGTFNIGPTSGIVKLAKELDFEDLRQPHIYSLIVTATEDSGGFSTSVEVTEFMFPRFALCASLDERHNNSSRRNVSRMIYPRDPSVHRFPLYLLRA